MFKNTDIKFRTNNSLENFNRFFKNKIRKKGEIELVKYVDSLIGITKVEINYFLKEIKKPHKSISTNRLNKDNLLNIEDNQEISENDIFEEIESSFNINEDDS